MAKKNSDSNLPVVEPTAETKPSTGTERILGGGTVRIPGPTLPVDSTIRPAVPVKPAAKPVPIPAFTVVSSQHIIKTLAQNADQNRMIRLKQLGRRNRDVAWLLRESEKQQLKSESN